MEAFTSLMLKHNPLFRLSRQRTYLSVIKVANPGGVKLYMPSRHILGPRVQRKYSVAQWVRFALFLRHISMELICDVAVPSQAETLSSRLTNILHNLMPYSKVCHGTLV